MKTGILSNMRFGIITAVAYTFIAFNSLQVNAGWWNSEYSAISRDTPQDIVVTLQQNPQNNPEAACLAVTMARMLRMGGTFIHPETNEEIPIVNNVTLFPTLDGVALGDADIVLSRVFRNYECNVPGQMGGPIMSLQENLEAFLYGDLDLNEEEGNKNMIVCPLCWMERYPEQLPDYGVIGLPDTVNPLLLNAEKVFDF